MNEAKLFSTDTMKGITEASAIDRAKYKIDNEKALSNRVKFTYPFIKNGDPVPNYISKIDMDKYEIVLRKQDKSL